MLAMGIPVGAGTTQPAWPALFVQPVVSLYWLVAGKRRRPRRCYHRSEPMDSSESVRRYTVGRLFWAKRTGGLPGGRQEATSGASADYFSVHEGEIKGIRVVLTVPSGESVTGPRSSSGWPRRPAGQPDWSPVKGYGGYPEHATNPIRLAHSARIPD